MNGYPPKWRSLTEYPFFFRLADPFVPSKYKTYFKQFSSGRDCQKIKCGTLAF